MNKRTILGDPVATPSQPIRVDRVWIIFAAGKYGPHIQRWATEPFEGADAYALASTAPNTDEIRIAAERSRG